MMFMNYKCGGLLGTEDLSPAVFIHFELEVFGSTLCSSHSSSPLRTFPDNFQLCQAKAFSSTAEQTCNLARKAGGVDFEVAVPSGWVFQQVPCVRVRPAAARRMLTFTDNSTRAAETHQVLVNNHS